MVFGQAAVQIIIKAKDEFSRAFNKANLSLQSFRKAAIGATVAGVAIAAGFAKALKTSIDFETAFTGVRKTVELTEQGFADLENRFKELTKVTPVTFKELSAIGEIAGQLGVEGVDNLEKFTRTIAGIAVTTNLTAEEAATSFARIANIMQEPIENVDKMASVVVELGNNFATTEGEIVTFAQRIAGAGKLAGLTTDQILAIGAAFSSVGVQAEAGGTATQKVLIAMTEATAAADISMEELEAIAEITGKTIEEVMEDASSKLDDFAETAGMTAEEFRKAFQEDAGKAFAAFVKGLGQQGTKAFKTLEDLELQDQRLVRAFLSLANAGDLVTDTLGTATKEWETNTAAVIEAEKRYNTLQSQIDIAKNKFALLGDEIGDRIAPFLEKVLLPALDKIIGAWDSLSPKMQDSILIFAGVTAAVFLLAGAIALVTLASSPWLLIIFAIAAVISALIIFWTEIVDTVQKGIIVMVVSFQTLKDAVVIVWAVIKNAAVVAWNFIVKLIESSINAILGAINSLIRIMNKIPGINIPIIPRLDLSGIKGELTDIGELRSSLAAERIATAAELTRRAGIEVNIENVVGLDPEEISRALSDELNNKFSR